MGLFSRSCLYLLLLLFWAAVALAAPVQIVCEALPAHPDQNRLQNADFARHEGSQPTDWPFMSARPDNFIADWAAEGCFEPGALHLKTLTGNMSGYFHQAVPVQAGEKLMVWARVRTAGGKTLFYLTGDVQPPGGQRYGFDQRALLSSQKSFPLAPVWIKREYLRGPDPRAWNLLAKTLSIPEGMSSLTVHLGSYFMPGEFWADDLYAGPAVMDVTVKVSGAPLKQVAILAGKETLADSGALNGVTEWQRVLPGLPADPACVVRVTTTDGQVTTSAPCPPPCPAN